VYATFQCLINKIDEKKKEQLSQEMYRQRRTVVGDTRAAGGMEDTDDEDLIGYDSIEPGLPPASSDRRKWWLDNGIFLSFPLIAFMLIFGRSARALKDATPIH
jgi:hypothetical protein